MTHGDIWVDHEGESDDVVDSNESLEELLVMERTANRFPSAGDDVEDPSEDAGLGHALATRTPGPKMRRGDVDPLPFGTGMGAGTKDMGVEGRWSIEERLGFARWSGNN